MSPGLRAAIEAAEAFIADEFAALRAMYDEPDDTRYRQIADRAAAHLHSVPGAPLTLGFDRPAGPAGQISDAERQAAADLVPRRLFAVTAHPRGPHTVYRAIVGDHYDAEGSLYALALHLAPVEGALKIVGEAAADPFTRDELRWEDMGGDQLEDAGPPTEAAQLHRPLHPLSAAHFDALAAQA